MSRHIGPPAPADARPHPAWPLWAKILAYVALALLATLAIWYVDRKVHVIHVPPAGQAASAGGRSSC